MAKLWITELNFLSKSHRGGQIMIPKVPPLAEQVVTYTTSEQSAALNMDTNYIRVIADADVFLEFGANPTATNGSLRLPADVEAFFGITPGHKVAAYDGTS